MTDDSGRTSPVNSEEALSTVNISDDIEDDILVPPKKAKKRVQFHSGENLVRIREIPPRSPHTTDDEDSGCSDDDTEDDDDDDDDDDEDSENDDESNWPSSVNAKPGSNMPTIVNNAVKLDCVPKRSYEVSRSKGRTSHIVAQITGVNSRPKPRKNNIKDRKSKKIIKSCLEKPTESSKSKQRNCRKKSPKKLDSDKDKVIPPVKKTKEVKIIKPSTLTLSKTSSPRPYGRFLSPIKKTTSRHDTHQQTVSSIPNGFDKHLASTNLALQTMSVGKLYTVDGFIFPSDPSEDIKTKSVNGHAESENEKSDVSKAVLQRKKCFAWQMANGDQRNMVGTPCILPMWESVHSHPPSNKNGLKTKI